MQRPVMATKTIPFDPARVKRTCACGLRVVTPGPTEIKWLCIHKPEVCLFAVM